MNKSTVKVRCIEWWAQKKETTAGGRVAECGSMNYESRRLGHKLAVCILWFSREERRVSMTRKKGELLYKWDFES